MDTRNNTCEIVELTKELDSKINGKSGSKDMIKSGYKYSIEDDINRLFEAIDVRTSSKGFHQPHRGNRDPLGKSALKKPVRVGSYQAFGIGISENVSLKQALRGLSISQASEMAAIKRLSKPAGSSRISEAGTIKRLYSSVVIEAGGSHLPMNKAKGKLLEISVVTERITSICSADETMKVELPIQSAHPSTTSADAMTQNKKMRGRLTSQDQVATSATEVRRETLKADGGMKPADSVFTHIATPSIEVPIRTPMPEKKQKGDMLSSCSVSSSSTVSKLSKPFGKSPRLTKPIFSKKFVTKKAKQDLTSSSCSLNSCEGKLDNDLDPCTSNLTCHTGNCTLKNEQKETDKAFVMFSSTDFSSNVDSSTVDSGSSKLGFSLNCEDTRSAVTKVDESSRSREKGEFSRSSKSSIGNYSSSASISGENNLSGSNCNGHRPHMSRDLRWEAIRCVQKHHGSLGLRHFKLLKRLGCGDIGTVYLAALTGTNCLFAVKVMDNEYLRRREKMPRAQTEREILQILDHPFLPTLYAHFSTDKFSCLVMEYCPGGDLHVLRQKQPHRSFSEQAARFFVAEVLLTLEYLHMLGVVYRDLKAENILVREDGHIMLTDFDLSFRCAVNPILLKSSIPIMDPTKKIHESSCIDPFCFQPSFSCFTPRILSASSKTRKIKSDLAAQVSPLPQLVVEPTSARSNSFVGTHEYLAPEIIKGEGHGSAVDWWTFGIFLFELLFGKTPFKGSRNEDTLANVVSRSLKFPNSPMISFQARDLIRGLLVKDPGNRLGSVKGAAEIKQHPFFVGINWALIRCAVPPELPKFSEFGFGTPSPTTKELESVECNEFEVTKGQSEFDLF